MKTINFISYKKTYLSTLIIIVMGIVTCILFIMIISAADTPLNNLPTPITSPTMEPTTIPTGILFVTGEYSGLGSLVALIACFFSLIVFCSYKSMKKRNEIK